MWQKICRLVIKYNDMNLNNFTLKAQKSVQRLIQKEIVNELSKEIIGGKVSKEDTIVIDIADDHLSFNKGAKQKEDLSERH